MSGRLGQPHAAVVAPPSTAILVSLAVALAALVPNFYYAQPLIAVIASDIGLDPGLAGFIPSVTQIGYALGLFFFVSLADRFENKVLTAIGCTIASLLVITVVASAAAFLAAAFCIGLCARGAQVLLLFAAQLVP